jgi:hypothetical protein
VGPVKSNLAVIPNALLWTREEDGPIVWHGDAGQRLDQLLDVAVASSPRADAEGFLRDYLASGSQPSANVEAAAKAAGLSWATVKRAADDLSVAKRKATGTTDGRWFWSLPAGTPTLVAMRPHESAPNLLTSRDIDVSKLSKFDVPKLLNGGSGEQVLTTTPISRNGHQHASEHVMEGAQLAHSTVPSSEQVGCTDDSSDTSGATTRPHAERAVAGGSRWERL